MSKYRKKPVVIDAVQYRKGEPIPEGVCVGGEGCTYAVYGYEGDPVIPGIRQGVLHVHTLEGAHYVSDGDWIITGVKGERYPCKPEIFAMTYELDGEASSHADLDEIEATARAATPGPWLAVTCGLHREEGACRVVANMSSDAEIRDAVVRDYSPDECRRAVSGADAAHIAIANPSAVLAWVAEMRKARQVVAALAGLDLAGEAECDPVKMATHLRRLYLVECQRSADFADVLNGDAARDPVGEAGEPAEGAHLDALDLDALEAKAKEDVCLCCTGVDSPPCSFDGHGCTCCNGTGRGGGVVVDGAELIAIVAEVRGMRRFLARAAGETK